MNVENVEMNMAVHDGEPFPGFTPVTVDMACAARSDMCVLLSGPPAAAREVAYSIHNISGWRHGEFLIVDCVRNEALLERLFTAPTADDAPPRQQGPGLRLVQAGSVLLEEVGELSPALQERLADHLAAARLETRYGRSRWRFFASSAEPLADRVANGTFSDLLFYRLNTIHLAVPAPTLIPAQNGTPVHGPQ